MRRRDLVSYMAAGLAVPFLGCGRREDEAGRVIRVSYQPRTQLSALFVAVEEGYFTELGLNVRPYQFPGSAEVVPLLAGGRMDVSFSGINPAIINAVAKGARIKVVAGKEYASTTCGAANTLFGSIKAFPNGLDDLRQLKGKRVSIRGLQTTAEFALDAMLQTVGLSTDDVELVFMRQQDAAGALVSGRIDALVSTHFERSPEAVSNAFVKGADLADVYPGHQRSVIFFGPGMLDADFETGVRFLSAYLLGANGFADGKTPAFLEELARASGVSVEEARSACRETLERDGRIDWPSIERIVSWASRRGYCPRTVTPDDLIDDRYIAVAQERVLDLKSPATSRGLGKEKKSP